MDINDENLLVRLSSLLPDPETPGLDFNTLIIEEHVSASLSLTGKFAGLQKSVEEFRRDYNLLLLDFLTDYRQILETALAFPEHDTDNSKTTELIDSINEFIDSQLSDPQKQL